MQVPVSRKELGVLEKEGYHVRDMVEEREDGAG